MSVGALSVYPYSAGLPTWQADGPGIAGARRGPYTRPAQADEAGRATGAAAREPDVHTGFADGEARSAPNASPEAAWQSRRQGPSALLAAMIENMGGAATSAYKGMYVDVRV
ncbi:MAG: hypothetical protein HY943_15230 [Gammaproteobacteria bacterium]|nr:hypothetical protein [Gammaproteobacteria bacterium]